MAYFDKESFDPKKILPRIVKFYSVDLSNPHTYLISSMYLRTGVDKISELVAEYGNKVGVFVDALTGYEITPGLIVHPISEKIINIDTLVGNNGLETFLEYTLPVEIITTSDQHILPAQQEISEQITNNDNPKVELETSLQNETVNTTQELKPIGLEINHFMDYIPIENVNYDPLYESTVDYMVWWIDDNDFTDQFPVLQMQNHYVDEIPYPNDYPDDKEQVVDYMVWWD